jgi:hypothetical protein
MINVYGFTYPGAMTKIPGYVLVKVGDSIRDVQTRIKEQGDSTEYENKITVGEWNNLKHIKRDYVIHKHLKRLGLHHLDGKGTEWFKIPGSTVNDSYLYIDNLITKLEGKKVRNKVTLRKIQSSTLDKAIDIIAKQKFDINIVANLCPRFGKTIWSLMLFNEITKRYGNRIMLLPAYWLSVHPSSINEVDKYDNFLDIEVVDTDKENCAERLQEILDNGQRAIVPISLHGDIDTWIKKYKWIAALDKKDLFVFSDEGDFGTHAERQKEKLKFLFDFDQNDYTDLNHKFVKVFASGTNMQRLAKCCNEIDGVLYTAYSQLEQSDATIVRRKFFLTHVADLKAEVEQFNVNVMPSWAKIWGKPLGNKAFIDCLFKSLTGKDTLRTELNLANITNDQVDCFMLLVSANKAEMEQIASIAKRSIPDWEFVVLNGDYTTNKDAEYVTETAINKARHDKKSGVIVIANQMGSRSYSIPEIQATVIAYDRGSVDATTQKVSRCLTPGNTFDGTAKTHGYIVDLSFDPNRAENVERLILEEAIQIQRSDNVDFTAAVKYVLSSIDLFKLNGYGSMVEVKEEDMFRILGDNENLLRVADISVDIAAALESGIFDILSNVNATGKNKGNKKPVVGEGVKNSVTDGDDKKQTVSDKEKRNIEKIINSAIRALNMSATSVYDLAETGDSYRECLEVIAARPVYNTEFKELFGVSADDALTLVKQRVLNDAILDVVVQNSKTLYSPFN